MKKTIPFIIGSAAGTITVIKSERRRDEAKYAYQYGCLDEVRYGKRQEIYEDLREYHTSLWRPVLTKTPYRLSEVFAQQKSFSVFDRSSPVLATKFCKLNNIETYDYDDEYDC